MKTLLITFFNLINQFDYDDVPQFGPGGKMPNLPFEVHYSEYNKTVHVVASCEARKDAVTLTFDPSEGDIKNEVYTAIIKAFDQPGIVRVQVCRK